MLNFKLDFEQKFARGLVEGGYATPAEFAQAVTRFYMTTIVKGTPAGIPPTLPVGYVPFNPAPIGPASPVPYRNREKIFYNTIKTYYTIKDLNNTKSFIAFATRDIQNAVKTSIRLKQEIEEKIKRISEIDDEVKQLKEDLKSIGPEIRDYFNEKKNTFLKLAKSVEELVSRLDELPLQEAAQGGAGKFFAEEIAIFNTIKNFKIDISNIKEAVLLVNNTLKQATAKQRKYENDFSTQANIRVFFWKRLQAFLTEVAKIIGTVINPADSIGYLKELLYVPKAQKFARIMIRIINRNAQLKYQKDTLMRSIDRIKQEIEEQVKKRIDGMNAAIQEKVKKLSGIQRKGGQKKAKRDSMKRLKEELKIVAQDVKFAIKVVGYFTKLLNTVVTITTKITLLIDEFKEYWNTTIKQDILQRAKDGIQAIKDQINQSPEQGIDVNLIFKQFKITNNVIKTALDKILQSVKLTSPQILAKVKQPVDKFEQLLKAIEEILLQDLPSLEHSVNNPPKRDGSTARRSNKKQTKPVKPKKARKVTAAMILDKFTYAFNWLGELIERLRKDYVEKYKNEAISKLKKLQKDVTDYIAEITNFNPTQKKIQSKKREVDQERVELEDEKIKAQLIAKSAVLFAKMIQAGLKITNRLAPTDGSTRQLSISANERDLLDFFKYFNQWEILTKRKTEQQVAESTLHLKRKIKDFKVYEQIFEFFKEMVVEMKEVREDGKTFKDYINERLDLLQQRALDSATSDIKDRIDQIKGFFTTPPKTITDFANLPLGIFDIIDFNTDLFLGENRFLRKTRSKIKNLQDEIPADTQDSVLLFFREQLGKGVSVVGEMIKLFKRGVDKLIAFIKQTIIDPALKTVGTFIEERKVRLKNQQQEKARRKLDAEARRKIDAAAASFVFGLASRLFWTGLTWKNPVDTTFTVLNIGPFKPIDPNEYTTAAGIAEQMSKGFEGQVQLMTGLCTPNPSLAIPPFPFQGYI